MKCGGFGRTHKPYLPHTEKEKKNRSGYPSSPPRTSLPVSCGLLYYTLRPLFLRCLKPGLLFFNPTSTSTTFLLYHLIRFTLPQEYPSSPWQTKQCKFVPTLLWLAGVTISSLCCPTTHPQPTQVDQSSLLQNSAKWARSSSVSQTFCYVLKALVLGFEGSC